MKPTLQALTLAAVALTAIAGAAVWMVWHDEPVAALAAAAAAPCNDRDVLASVDAPALAAAGRRLVVRQSGGHDKVFVLELHAASTRFDECTRPSAPPLDEVPVDPGRGRLVSVTIGGDRLTPGYAPGSVPSVPVWAAIAVRLVAPGGDGGGR